MLYKQPAHNRYMNVIHSSAFYSAMLDPSEINHFTMGKMIQDTTCPSAQIFQRGKEAKLAGVSEALFAY